MIDEMIEKRNELNSLIDQKIREFLIQIDKAGGFAPGITKLFGGGHDDVEDIELADGNIILTCSNYFRGDRRGYFLKYPISLVENPDPDKVKEFVIQQREKKHEEMARKQEIDDVEKRQKELESLKELQKKYPGY